VSVISVVCGRKSTDQLGLTDERKSVMRQALDSPTSPNRGRWGGFGRDGQSSFGRDLPVASIRITPV
jgi:hypothetical protein